MPSLESDEEELKEAKGLKVNSKQIINSTSNFVSTNKSWSQFIQIKKRNKTSTISFASA